MRFCFAGKYWLQSHGTRLGKLSHQKPDSPGTGVAGSLVVWPSWPLRGVDGSGFTVCGGSALWRFCFFAGFVAVARFWVSAFLLGSPDSIFIPVLGGVLLVLCATGFASHRAAASLNKSANAGLTARFFHRLLHTQNNAVHSWLI